MTDQELLKHQAEHWQRQAQTLARIIHDLVHCAPNGLQDSPTWVGLCKDQDDELVMAWEEGLEEVAGRDWICKRCGNAPNPSEI